MPRKQVEDLASTTGAAQIRPTVRGGGSGGFVAAQPGRVLDLTGGDRQINQATAALTSALKRNQGIADQRSLSEFQDMLAKRERQALEDGLAPRRALSKILSSPEVSEAFRAANPALNVELQKSAANYAARVYQSALDEQTRNIVRSGISVENAAGFDVEAQFNSIRGELFNSIIGDLPEGTRGAPGFANFLNSAVAKVDFQMGQKFQTEITNERERVLTQSLVESTLALGTTLETVAPENVADFFKTEYRTSMNRTVGAFGFPARKEIDVIAGAVSVWTAKRQFNRANAFLEGLMLHGKVGGAKAINNVKIHELQEGLIIAQANSRKVHNIERAQAIEDAFDAQFESEGSALRSIELSTSPSDIEASVENLVQTVAKQAKDQPQLFQADWGVDPSDARAVIGAIRQFGAARVRQANGASVLSLARWRDELDRKGLTDEAKLRADIGSLDVRDRPQARKELNSLKAGTYTRLTKVRELSDLERRITDGNARVLATDPNSQAAIAASEEDAAQIATVFENARDRISKDPENESQIIDNARSDLQKILDNRVAKSEETQSKISQGLDDIRTAMAAGDANAVERLIDSLPASDRTKDRQRGIWAEHQKVAERRDDKFRNDLERRLQASLELQLLSKSGRESLPPEFFVKDDQTLRFVLADAARQKIQRTVDGASQALKDFRRSEAFTEPFDAGNIQEANRRFAAFRSKLSTTVRNELVGNQAPLGFSQRELGNAGADVKAVREATDADAFIGVEDVLDADDFFEITPKPELEDYISRTWVRFDSNGGTTRVLPDLPQIDKLQASGKLGSVRAQYFHAQAIRDVETRSEVIEQLGADVRKAIKADKEASSQERATSLRFLLQLEGVKLSDLRKGRVKGFEDTPFDFQTLNLNEVPLFDDVGEFVNVATPLSRGFAIDERFIRPAMRGNFITFKPELKKVTLTDALTQRLAELKAAEEIDAKKPERQQRLRDAQGFFGNGRDEFSARQQIRSANARARAIRKNMETELNFLRELGVPVDSASQLSDFISRQFELRAAASRD